MEGAICAMTMRSGSAMRLETVRVSSRAESAPQGQCVTHWPHSAQAASETSLQPAAPTCTFAPVRVASHTFRFCTLEHTLTQRMQLMHLLASRTKGKSAGLSLWSYSSG